MKRVINFIKLNWLSITIDIIVVICILTLGWSLGSKYTGIDYTKTIKDMEVKIKKDKKELIDSVAAFDSRISIQKKEIEKLSEKIKSQSIEITQIKKDYEIKRNHINSLDVDGTILESRKQLSK